MAKIKYYYDTVTCKYERVKTTTGDIIFNVLGIFSFSLALATGMLLLYSNYFESPKELILKNEVREMEFYYEGLNKKIEQLNKLISDLEYRDDNIYRSVLGAEPLDKNIREGGIGGADRYESIRKKNIIHKDLILQLSEGVDKLRRKVYLESKSQDEVVDLARRKEQMFAAIPAIQPISNKQLISLASGFGLRIHPVYKVKKMHYGIDFAAPIGTPIYSTADGTVTTVEFSFSGYGKMVEIDHGFGYKTRYAHMHGFAVGRGQKIKRGELIGYVGSTGLSTAPHLHYEVHINNIAKNPVYYLFNDLNAEEYERVLKLAAIENMSLGGN
jgi:murein DD-endopeptidase MepM/ murein hydrolase activator NlpD